MSALDRLRRGVVAAFSDSAHSDVDAPIVEVERESERDDAGGSAYTNTSTGAGIVGIDVGAAFTANFSRSRVSTKLALQIYRFSGLAQRLIDILPLYGTRVGWEVLTDDDTNIMQGEDRRLNTQLVLREAWRNGLRDGGCYVFMVTSERGNPELSEPLDPSRLISVDKLQVYERAEIDLGGNFNGDPRSDNYRRPDVVSIYPNIAGPSNSFRAHYSRLLWLPGNDAGESVRTRNGGWDDSYYDAILDSLNRREAVASSGATHATRLVIPVATLKDMKPARSGKGAPTFKDRMIHMLRNMSNTRGVALPEGDSVALLSASISGFKDLDDNQWSNLAADTGFPQTILKGDTPGGLNANDQSSKDAFDTRISAGQNSDIREPLEKLYAAVLASTEGPSHGAIPDDWSLTFSPLGVPTELETAQLRKTVAETDAIYVQSRVLEPEDIIRSRFQGEYSTEIISVDIPTDEGPAVEEEVEVEGRL